MTPRSGPTALLAILLLALCVTCSADNIGAAKRDLSDGTPVSFPGVTVTATLPGSIYVQANRGAGIRVDTPKAFTEGDIVDVSGTIQTDPTTDERCVAAYATHPQSKGSGPAMRPVGLSGRALVGGDFGRQKGIAGSKNLNTIGLLVTTWGPVAEFDNLTNPTWFKLGDGTRVVAPPGTKLDADLTYVAVTGICSVEKVNGNMTRVLKVRRAGDIVSHESWAEDRLKSMTLDEKIGQLFQIRIDGDVVTDATRQIIQNQHIGGIVYFQYNGNLNDPIRSARMSNELQTCAIGPDGKGIPLLISMDQEGGRVTRITGGCDFPGNMGIGASRSADLARLAGSVFGSEIRAVGANMDLAPVLDVNNNPDNPVIGVRSFGEQPDLAADMGIGYTAGLHDSGVIATGKHFPGHGDTNVDSHSGLPIVTYDFSTLDTIHGKPFRQAIANGLDCIMTAHIVVTCLDPNRPSTLSPLVIDGYLRTNLGFDGVVMTDSMGMGGITTGYGNAQAAVMVILAGADLISLPPDFDTAINAVKSAALSGEIPMSRIDQSVKRILRLKHRYGLFENPFVNADAASGIVGCGDHRAAELSVAKGAITLVQNTGNLLPLNLTSSQKALLVTVQSSTETTTDAATRFASYITARHPNTQSMSISESPNSTSRNNVKTAANSASVIIVGTSRAQLYPNQVTLINQLCALGKPVICVGMREPYEFASFPGVNAYLCAYSYRNCSFQAAADVIFGSYNPIGKLPVSVTGSYGFGWGLGY